MYDLETNCLFFESINNNADDDNDGDVDEDGSVINKSDDFLDITLLCFSFKQLLSKSI